MRINIPHDSAETESADSSILEWMSESRFTKHVQLGARLSKRGVWCEQTVKQYYAMWRIQTGVKRWSCNWIERGNLCRLSKRARAWVCFNLSLTGIISE